MRLPFARFTASLTLASICSLAIAAPALADTPTPVKSPSPAQIAEAKKHMQAGAAFYNDQSGHKCEEASREFAKAYELSGSLNALKGMATCNLELERDGEAIEQYTRFQEAKGAAIDAGDKKQIDTDLNALKAVVARITFNVDVPGARLADTRQPSRGFPITNRYPLDAPGRKLGIHPGQHTFTVSVEGQPDQTWTTEIANGGTYEHTFKFTKDAPAPVAVLPPVVAPPPKLDAPPEEPPKDAKDANDVKGRRPLLIAASVFTGVTVAAAVPWVIFMLDAKSKNTAYQAANHHETATQLTALQSGVKSANLNADILMGVTAASAITMTGLWVGYAVKKAPASAATGLVTIAPTAGPSGAGAVVVGAF